MEEVATPEPANQIVTYSVTEAEITRLAEEYKEVPTDLTVKANYELCRKATSTIRGLRGDVEKRRKELKADALAWGKKVDGEAKTITERLLAIEEPFALAKKDFDTAAEIAKREAVLAEERRVDGIADRIAGIKALVEANISSTSAVIAEILTKVTVDNLPCHEWAMEFSEKAHAVILETMEKLKELRDMKAQQENMAAQQAADEAKRKEEEELARQQREAEIEAERQKLIAERAEMDAERAKFAAEREAAGKEKARIEQAEADKKRAEEAEAYKPTGNHYIEAGDAIAKILGDPLNVKVLLDAIINDEIPHVVFTGNRP